MEAQFDDSRIITQFLPTLVHLASVKVAFLLMNKFGSVTLKKACRNIQEGTLIDSSEIYKDPTFFTNEVALLKCQLDELECEAELLKYKRKNGKREKELLESRKRALEKCRNSLESNMTEYCKTDPLVKQYMAQQIVKLNIPLRLMPRLMEVIQGMEFGCRRWKSYHSGILELKDEECTICWKSDGTVDRTKTAQQLILNKKIDIRKKFLLACSYCFEEIIDSLWLEMKASKTTGYFKALDNAMVHFWVRRMICVSPVKWKQDFCDYLHRYPQIISHFISVFPLLQPQDRIVFLPLLESAKLDVFRSCLRVMTTEEERFILESCPRKLLCSFLQWPLRSMFLETANKMWEYIDEFDFLFVLKHLFLIKKHEEYDISDLFEGFWKRGRRHFRKFANEYPGMKKKIKSWKEEIRNKEKSHFDELRSLTENKVS